MKIRIIKKITDGVFNVLIQTEDWSEYDRELMIKYGEPEINLGGTITYIPETTSSDSSSEEEATITFDDVYERIMTESPFTRKFDSRDFGGSVDNAKLVAIAWANDIENKIIANVRALRDKDTFFTTEEVMEY